MATLGSTPAPGLTAGQRAVRVFPKLVGLLKNQVFLNSARSDAAPQDTAHRALWPDRGLVINGNAAKYCRQMAELVPAGHGLSPTQC